jgi:hypothetical protein
MVVKPGASLTSSICLGLRHTVFLSSFLLPLLAIKSNICVQNVCAKQFRELKKRRKNSVIKEITCLLMNIVVTGHWKFRMT